MCVSSPYQHSTRHVHLSVMLFREWYIYLFSYHFGPLIQIHMDFHFSITFKIQFYFQNLTAVKGEDLKNTIMVFVQPEEPVENFFDSRPLHTNSDWMHMLHMGAVLGLLPPSLLFLLMTSWTIHDLMPVPLNQNCPQNFAWVFNPSSLVKIYQFKCMSMYYVFQQYQRC